MGCTPDRMRRVRTFLGVTVVSSVAVSVATSAKREKVREDTDLAVGERTREKEAMDLVVRERVYIRRWRESFIWIVFRAVLLFVACFYLVERLMVDLL